MSSEDELISIKYELEEIRNIQYDHLQGIDNKLKNISSALGKVADSIEHIAYNKEGGL